MTKKDPAPISPGASQRAQALRRLTELDIPVDGWCGLYKLTVLELTRLAEAIQTRVNREGARAFNEGQDAEELRHDLAPPLADRAKS